MLSQRAGFRTIARDVAGLQVVLSSTMVLSIGISLVYREWYSALGFAIAAAISAGLGGLVYRVCRDSGEPRSYHAMVIAAAGWMIAALFGALPFVIIAYITPDDVAQSFVPSGQTYRSSLENFENPLHAVFESMSCYATIGLTMAEHEPSIGKGLLAYRALNTWLGGAGMIVLSLAIIPRPGSIGGMHMFASESAADKVRPSIVGTARAIWKAYTLATAAIAAWLIIATFLWLPEHGVESTIFDAIGHAMSAMATGGMSSQDDGIATYKSYALEMAHVPPMIVGAISLPLLYLAARDRSWRVLWSDVQFRMMVGVLLIGGTVMIWLLSRDPAVEDPLREGVFQFASAVSTTGFQTSNVGAWNDASILWIVCGAMFVGGAAGSTVGGIKLIRSYMIFRAASWRIKKVFLPPEAVVPFKVGSRTVPLDDVHRDVAEAAVFTFLYIVILAIGMLVTASFVGPEYTMADILFETVSAQTSTGMSTGISNPNMHPAVEVTFILQMWIGRLEIFPIIVLLRSVFVWHGRRG